MVANNEYLPYFDATFDCYMANLSLMLVDNYKNMLKEAIRVTIPGATFGFTIYGREGYFGNYELLLDVLYRTKLLPEPAEKPKKTIYDLSRHPEILK